MAVHVHYNSWYISLPAVLRKTALYGEREPRWLIFYHSVTDLVLR